VPQVGIGQPQLEQGVDHPIDQHARLRAKIVGDFAPFAQFAVRGAVNLPGGNAGRGLGEVTAIALAEVAPLVFGAAGQAVSGLLQDLNEGKAGNRHLPV
jgi:hypothetical protein